MSRPGAPANDGDNFRDYRKFNNRSRLNMPVALYLAQVLFRAFRFDPSFTLTNVNGDAVGLLALGWLTFRCWRREFSAARHLPVRLWAMYWHFVAAVWLLMFITVYAI